MTSFLENEEKVRAMVKPFAEKYNFQVSITKDSFTSWYERLILFNDKCKVVIYNDLRYETIGVECFVNPKSEIKNEYRLIDMVRLRKIPLMNDIEPSDKSFLEDIEFELQFIDLHFKDILEGDFSSLDMEGYLYS